MIDQGILTVEEATNESWKHVQGNLTMLRSITAALARDRTPPKKSEINTKQSKVKTKALTLKQELMKVAKRDISVFPYLKDERFGGSWRRWVVNLAMIWNVGEVLDPKYKPNSTQKLDLFIVKNEYMYAVF